MANMKTGSEAIGNAVKYIEENIGTMFIMESVAGAAGYSLYHFCRLFSLVVGMSPGEYIRKRRLSEAARLLASTGKPVGEIAREYTFQSHEAFTRSFKALFGLPPERYRRETERARPMKPFILMDASCITEPRYIKGEPVVERLEKTVVIGRSTLCDLTDPGLNHDAIIALWDRTAGLLDGLKGSSTEAERFGIGFPIKNREEEPVIGYLAGIRRDRGMKVPADFDRFTIPAGEYLHTVHRGGAKAETETFIYLYGMYIPASGLRVSRSFDFDIYTLRFNRTNPESADSEIDVYIPVEPACPS